MSIIANIRKFLRLDKTVLSIDKKSETTIGLYMSEWKEYKKEIFGDCQGLYHIIDKVSDLNHPIHHSTDAFHLHQPIHFSHC